VIEGGRLLSARDRYHDEVKRALLKEQWTITKDPFSFDYYGTYFQIDLAADRLLAAEKGDEKIAIEIKSFLRQSTITDFYAAVGQYLCYRAVLEETEPERKLFLAVPIGAYRSFFETPFAKLMIQRYQIALLIYDVEREVITQWQ
jgi:XisH protein